MDSGKRISSVDDIRQYCLELWLSNSVLRAYMGCETLFPLVITLQRPAGSDSAAVGLMRWKAELESHCQCHLGYGFSIEYEDVRLHHAQSLRLPRQLVFAQLNDLVLFIHKGAELNRFSRLYGQLRKTDEQLALWCESRPLQLLEYEQIVPALLSTVHSLSEKNLSVEAALHSNAQLVNADFLLQYQDLIDEWLRILTMNAAAK